MTDIINGLDYIHHSPLRVHSNLKSSNCLVDNRWVLKLTDFGMTKNNHLKKNSVSGHLLHKDYFWTAPEVLRHESHVSRKADVYSVGIILYELVLRIQPYETTSDTPKDIIEIVKNGSCPPLRPNTSLKDPDDNTGIPVHIIALMESCWAEESDNRPEVGDIKKTIIRFNNGRKANIVDNMIVLLERYANNLEEIVDQRTSELIQERRKSDMLLKRMLPTIIADKLRRNELVVPEMFESVSIYFSDIVGFTAIATISTAIQIVDLLNDLYTIFDNIISRYDVYKVETIGDAYMVVSGLPERNGDRHITEIADMSLEILQEIKSFKIAHLPEEQCAIRIGLHTGPCAAGVVGLIMPRYCLFGDTVNMASRMETYGQACRIHISSTTAQGLQTTERYCLCERGELDVKGKGKQTTFWLLGKQD
ncbi:atrial natriuretic peptide receptor 2 [Patella vulgata]|uniref:atrial natriuretic peptide receptor 2 n=1 Tax=Patella vulgata TaxID=6465 RepID=UPI0024A84D7B|nr:atrial natriuretic peptide receptor 2 [Patella vulgata]